MLRPKSTDATPTNDDDWFDLETNSSVRTPSDVDGWTFVEEQTDHGGAMRILPVLTQSPTTL